jgi:hypothetical protein
VEKLGADKILTEADSLCAAFREDQEHSYFHRNCAHGLGHGFMGAMDNELFDALQGCDSLGEEWEQIHCYGGVFMQNTMVEVDPSLPSKYLKSDDPLYPCTDVQSRHKDQCYKTQAPYAVGRQGDFAKVFDLCAKAEEGFQPSCYEGMGWAAAGEGITGEGITHPDANEATKETCMVGEDYEAQSNCVVGAVRSYIVYYHDGPQPKEMCESLEADLRDVCLEAANEYYKDFQE